MKKTIATLLLCLLAAANPAAAQTAGKARHVQIRLVPESTQIQPGATMMIGIEETIEPGWHTYWVNPGDSGQAPDIKWTLPPGFVAGDIKWPVPQKLVIGPLVDYGYTDKATLLQEMTAPGKLPSGPVKISASIDILVCKDICIPEQGTYELTLNGGAPVQDNSAYIDTAYGLTPHEFQDWPVTFKKQDGQFMLTVDVLQTPFLATMNLNKPVYLLPVDWGIIDNAAKPGGQFHPPSLLMVRQKAGDRDLSKLDTVNVMISYEDNQGTRRALSFNAAPDPLWRAPAVSKQGVRLSLAKALPFAVLGGIVLNLMPCVFPVLSLKTLKLINVSGSELREAQRHSLVYTLGILVSFAALAAALTILRHAGQQVGWGFQLQNPAFVLPLSWLLFVIGLSLSGFFEFGAGLANVGGRLTQGHGLAPSFFTGVLAAVVATPCTAPFMGVALGYALTQPPAITFAVLLALGLGLALPFLVISYVPALRSLLPKPGAWMVTFRELLSFPLYASAAWLTWVFSMQAGPASVMTALAGAVAITFALWLLQKKPASKGLRFFTRLLALVAILGAVALIPFAKTMEKQTVRADAMGGDWLPYTAESFDELQKGDGALFVDMTAAWCITCKVNESTVLNTPAIMDLFHMNKVQTIRGDWTNRNPDITSFLAGVGRDGVPLYVYYGPRDTATHQRPDPVVLPQILTAGIVEKTVKGQ